MANMPEHVAERLRRLGAAAKESATLAGEDRTSRNAAIVEADDAAWPLQEIARQVGLAASHVQRIVAEATADRQAAAAALLDKEIL